MIRVGIISDTHGKLHPTVAEHFAGVDHIIHAGDIGDEDLLRQLAEIAPLTAVAGNIEDFRCGPARAHARVKIDGLRFFVTHILPRPSKVGADVQKALSRERADVVIFGHSHLPHDEQRDGVWYFNPASAGARRFDYPTSVGMFEKRRSSWSARHIALDSRSIEALDKYMNQMR